MIERNNILATGIALIDQKTRLTNECSEVEFREENSEKYPGGITPNIVSTYVRLVCPEKIKLFAKVGYDINGNIYIESSPELKPIQVDEKGQTGLSLAIFNQRGRVIKTKTEYHIASEFVVSDKELEKSGPALFISDLFTLQIPHKFKDIQRLTQRMQQQGGYFALNIAGIQKLKTPISEFLSQFNYSPHFIFGNEREMQYLGENVGEIVQFLPDAKLLVVTRGEKGSLIYCDGQALEIPAITINGSITDEYGAGDCFMGTLLAGLTRRDLSNWTPNTIVHNANVASYAASLVLQNLGNRLTDEQIFEIRGSVNSYV